MGIQYGAGVRQLTNGSRGGALISSDNDGNLSFLTRTAASTTGSLIFNNVPANMVLTNESDLGVGTTTPEERFHLEGASQHDGSAEFYLTDDNETSVQQAVSIRSTYELSPFTIALRSVASRHSLAQAGDNVIGVETYSSGGNFSYSVKASGVSGTSENYGVYAVGDSENFEKEAYGVYGEAEYAKKSYGLYGTTKAASNSTSTTDTFGVYGYATSQVVGNQIWRLWNYQCSSR